MEKKVGINQRISINVMEMAMKAILLNHALRIQELDAFLLTNLNLNRILN